MSAPTRVDRATGATPHRPTEELLSGVDAIVRLLALRHQLDEREGLRTGTMVSGYPGSPLGTLDLAIEQADATLAAEGVVHRPGLNEELAAATVWGSQMGSVLELDDLDGVVGAWYGKTPGLDRSGDAMKHGNAMGAGPNGGVVMFCGDDPTAKSSTLTCDSQHTFEDACIPVLYPASPQEVLDLGAHAFRLSRYSGAWVGLKVVTSVADGVGTVDLDPDRLRADDPVGVMVDGVEWRHVPQRTMGPHVVPDQEVLVVHRRLEAAKAYVRHNGLDRVLGVGAGPVGGLPVTLATGGDRGAGRVGPGAPAIAGGGDQGGGGLGVPDVAGEVHEDGGGPGGAADPVDGPGTHGTNGAEAASSSSAGRAGLRPQAELGIVCAGKTALDVLEAFQQLGVGPDDLADHGIAVLKLAMTWPVVEETVREFAASVDQLVVVEEKRPFLEGQVRAILHEAGIPTPVQGKRDAAGRPLVSNVGELGPTSVAAVLRRVRPGLAAAAPEPPARRASLPVIELPGRPPGFCSGCPHNRSTVVPAGSVVGGGVGCHGIMYFEARNADLTSLPPTPMGAEGVPWIGLAPFVSEPHVFQNLGDGTLSHSGTLAIRASVAAGADITFKVLYNAAVAMTGGQDVTGLMDVPSMTRALEAEGVRRIVVCAEDPTRYGAHARWADGVTVVGRDRLPEVQEELRGVKGVTVIVYDQRCAAEARRLRKKGDLPTPPRRVLINELVCEGCGDCGVKSNCLSVQPLFTELGEKRTIDDPSCNRDYTCLDGDCPSFVTVSPKAGARRRAVPAAERPRPTLPTGTLPLPVVPDVDGRFNLYFTGIGGTGVVTANRILARAAEAGGLTVAGMDQTGLSQKAGAVVSHLHLVADGSPASPTVGDGDADLYLSGDILQAAAERHLAKVKPTGAVAVVDADCTPTAAMLQADVAPPDAAVLRAEIEAWLGDGATFVESRRIADDVFANSLLANIVLLGAAFQRGGLPLSLDQLDAAMASHGRAGTETREAFAWGRWAVHDPAAVEARLAAAEDAHAGGADLYHPSAKAVRCAAALLKARPVPADVGALVRRRAAQVVDYQGPKLAWRYLDLVAQVAATDDADQGWALTEAVADAWHQVLTYKDEYEVARLHLKVDYDRVAADLGIEGGYEVKYHLHPPSLRRLGMKRKLPLGRPYEVAFRGLRALRKLRGTPLDVFGRDQDRVLERAVVDEYAALVDDVVRSSASYDIRLRAVRSVMQVKGFDQIKAASVERWRSEVADLRPMLRTPAPVSRP